jgi:hypothetical protein
MKAIDCTAAERWIVQDLDEGLDEEKRTLLKDHLATCEICFQFREEISGLLSRFSADIPEDPGEEFWTRYHSSLSARLEEKEPPRSWAMWWKPAAAFAVVVLAIGAFMVAEFGPGTGQQTVGQPTLSPTLIAELDTFYGPISEEDQTPGISSEQVRILIGSGASMAEDTSLQWFEVEDETNHAFL